MAVCSSNIPSVEYEDIVSGQGILNKDIREKSNIRSGIRFEPGDVLFGKLRPYLKNWILPNFSGVAVGDFWVLHPFETDSRYLYYLIQTPAFQTAANQSTGTKMPRSDWNLVSKAIFFSPKDITEQRKIGATLQSIDHLITLHQRMCVFLGSMVRIRMDSPLAFAWEQRKLDEVFTSLQNNTLSRAELSSEQGGALNVHYGDVLIKFGEYLDLKKEVLPMISDSSIIGKYKASFLQNGDVIVADTAEDETVGKCSEIAGLTDEIALSGLHTIPYRPMFKFASGFLGYYMNSNSYHSQLLPLMQGIKVTSISKSAMRNTDICYPKTEDEQAEISTFFRTLDYLITLHQREPKHIKNNK